MMRCLRNRIWQARNQGQSGFVLALMAIAMLALLLMAGFAVDLGSWYLTASRLQRATDSAALAGAASLPDTRQAVVDVTSAYNHNGYSQTVRNGIKIVNKVDTQQVDTTLTQSNVTTYFTGLLFPHLSISRHSIAERVSTAPALGSPYNVLGSGDLNIAGIPKQNFWLAINGNCSPKEDGDFFSAQWDGNKGPLNTAQTDKNGFFIPQSTAVHHCPGSGPAPAVNPDYDPDGYSYFVDVPPPPKGGNITLRVYDGASGSNDPNLAIDLPNEDNGSFNTVFYVWDTKGTPDDASDDQLVASKGFMASTPQGLKQWTDLYTIPNDAISRNGGQFRIQVEVSQPQDAVQYHHGVNGFALEALRSWGSSEGCDSRNPQDDCPRVSGRNAESVFNNISSGNGSTATYYFASVSPTYIGRPFSVYLWDPGEGVTKMELIGPDGKTPLHFDWSTSPPGDSGTDAVSLPTGGTGPPAGLGLSNNFKFNDRLVTLKVTLPPEYTKMVDNANGNDWISIRYTLGSAPTDRTTWGISMTGGSSMPVHLLRTGS